ncbi:hypothetical protein D3C78_1680830 [compost metagenome]
MHGLGVELLGEGDDLALSDGEGRAFPAFADRQVVQIAIGHVVFLMRTEAQIDASCRVANRRAP